LGGQNKNAAQYNKEYYLITKLHLDMQANIQARWLQRLLKRAKPKPAIVFQWHYPDD